MPFLYGVKGCSHCDSRDVCPKILKNSESNLLKEVNNYRDSNGMNWQTFCEDFFRLFREIT
ncbi:unnamed protein product [marine sediment metagenome]|uniref:Uncharacterized protein n=1 Tax=marine sediment metagenome TaxID=412755 RepID=X1E669_9ZZZZ